MSICGMPRCSSETITAASIDTSLDIKISFPQNLGLQTQLENSPSTMSELASGLRSPRVATRTVDRLVEKGLAGRTMKKTTGEWSSPR